jgi:Uma2 family endonuclease
LAPGLEEAMTIQTAKSLITVDEYYRLGDAGAFGDERTELIEGRVYFMSPIGTLHAMTVSLLNTWLARQLGDHAILSPQNPFRMSEIDEPQPDLTIVRWPFAGDTHPGPADALLVIEVAVSSVRFDRKTKLPRYARFGVPELWIVLPRQRRVDVYTGPDGDGFRDCRHIRAGQGEVLTPHLLTSVALAADELFAALPSKG